MQVREGELVELSEWLIFSSLPVWGSGWSLEKGNVL